MIKIGRSLLDSTSAQAKGAARRRMNYNFHKNPSDTLQRMLNAMEPFSYVQPHKHEDPDKREIFFSLRGRIIVIEFDELGNIADHILLDPAAGNFGVEIPARIYHTIISLDHDAVAYEVKDGPYAQMNDKHFASWAPKEGDSGSAAYLTGLINDCAIESL